MNPKSDGEQEQLEYEAYLLELSREAVELEAQQEQRDSHGLEGFIPDWDPESETKEEYEERKQKEADAVLPFI